MELVLKGSVCCATNQHAERGQVHGARHFRGTSSLAIPIPIRTRRGSGKGRGSGIGDGDGRTRGWARSCMDGSIHCSRGQCGGGSNGGEKVPQPLSPPLN